MENLRYVMAGPFTYNFMLKYLKKHGGDSKKKDSEGRSCKKIAKDNKAVWNLKFIQ